MAYANAFLGTQGDHPDLRKARSAHLKAIVIPHLTITGRVTQSILSRIHNTPTTQRKSVQIYSSPAHDPQFPPSSPPRNPPSPSKPPPSNSSPPPLPNTPFTNGTKHGSHKPNPSSPPSNSRSSSAPTRSSPSPKLGPSSQCPSISKTATPST